MFKTINGKPVNVVKHTLDVLRDNPTVQIHIGTDSQNQGEYTTYSTVIAYRFARNGVHYIVSKHKEKAILDMWTRLWKEAEDSIEIAEWLTQLLFRQISSSGLLRKPHLPHREPSFQELVHATLSTRSLDPK